MLKKRFVGVVTVRNGWAVQSFGYRRYLPLGRPEYLVDNLDRWGADEILVQSIDRTARGLGPDFALLDRLARLGLSTPLIYGGGVRSVADGVEVVQRGADRITIDALVQDASAVVAELSASLGAQAVIASLPVSVEGSDLLVLDYRTREKKRLDDDLRRLLEQGHVSEVLMTDWQNEGTPVPFNERILDKCPLRGVDLIAFGGISSVTQMQSILGREQVAAMAVGNFLSYKEHAVQQFRNAAKSAVLRPSSYDEKYSLLRHV